MRIGQWSIQRRIGALLGALAVAFILLIPAITAMQGRHTRAMVSQGLEAARASADIERYIGLDRIKFASFIIDYTWWDELAEFVKKPDRTWAADNIDSSLDTVRADVIWVLNRDMRVVYTVSKKGSRVPAEFPVPEDVLRTRMEKQPFFRTNIAVPGGIAELRAGRIHYSNDPNRAGPFTGYLVAAHLWNDQDRRDVESLTGCKVRLVMGATGGEPEPLTSGPASYSFTVPLAGYDDAVLGRLCFFGIDEAAAVLADSERQDRWLIISFAAVLYGFLALILSRWVRQPLKAISAALEAEAPGPLSAIEGHPDEFGKIAANLRLFFEQKVLLEREIAERERAEQALRASEEHLKALTVELQRSNRELQDFASVASHDLQEPLRKISAFGGRLRTKFGESLPEDGQDYLARMMSAVERMSGLIEDLLTYSRVTTRAKPFEKLDLGVVVAEVLSDLETRIQQTGGSVEVGDLPSIEADPTQMRQVFQNLIGNALKFRREGVPPVVRIHAEIIEAPEGERCRIEVSDNGIGFDEQYSERIFRVFERLHGREQYEGTGVGLAIVKKIAERHGGTVVASGRPNEGATFTLTLPVRQARPAPNNDAAQS